jgi:hypothetical protein
MSDPKMTMEVPPQVRDFAVKNVDQAERAISSFMESASKSVASPQRVEHGAGPAPIR